MKRPNLNYPARVNIKRSPSAEHTGGITETEDIRRLLSDALGREISDREMRDIAKGQQLRRWVMLVHAVRQCDRKLAARNLSATVWLATNRAKIEYLAQMGRVSRDLGEISKGAHQAAVGKEGQVCLDSSGTVRTGRVYGVEAYW